jgi:hypothetical protein
MLFNKIETYIYTLHFYLKFDIKRILVQFEFNILTSLV